MNKERLLKLAEFLKTVPREKFDMNVWASDDATKNNCGTAGCAVGWAATCFKRSGFYLDNSYCEFNHPPIPAYKEFTDWNAVREFFKITLDESYYLFSPSTYFRGDKKPSPQTVAKRIQQFVKRGGISRYYEKTHFDYRTRIRFRY